MPQSYTWTDGDGDGMSLEEWDTTGGKLFEEREAVLEAGDGDGPAAIITHENATEIVKWLTSYFGL